ncbi:MAG: cytochrome b/b6 domain-containing protein [Paracoccaceae bacterium]|nr:cytochrome b/b6 domain-containing protein [Paracoccaceae bacterium]
MALANTNVHYGTVSKVFHWLTALLILTAIPTGLIANGLPVDEANLPLKAQLFSVHKTLGVAAFFVALLRILWAVSQIKPEHLLAGKPAQTFLAETVHWLLYASLVIVPLSGWLHHAATSGFAPILWPLGQTLPLVPQSEAVAGFFRAWHLVFTKVLAVAVLLHIVGALKHHFIDRDATLRRMWFGTPACEIPQQPAPSPRPALTAGAIYAVALVGASVLAFVAPHHSGPVAVAAPALEEQSGGNWRVETGTLGLTVTNFGQEVEGSFADWTAAIAFDEAAVGDTRGEVDVTVSIPSLTLGSVTSEALGSDYFAAETFPTARFVADIREDGEGYVADGTLTIRDQSVPVSLPFTLTIDGQTAEMTGDLALDRRDFGIGGSTEGTVAFSVGVSVSLTAQRVEAGS